MHLVGTHRPQARAVTADDVTDLELGGTWVVDVRRGPRPAERVGWLVAWEDDIAFLTDDPRATAQDASELAWPPSASPLDAA